MKLVIQKGRVVDPERDLDRVADVVCEDGKIVAILEAGKAKGGDRTIDASRLVVCPGFIDLHTHLREPGFEASETIETGTRAAARGGFTAVCCMANTDPVNDNAAVTELIKARSVAAGGTRVFPIGALTRNLAGEELADIGDLKAAGCVAVSDDGHGVMNAGVMRRGMEYARSFDLPVVTHAEDRALSGAGVMHEGVMSCRLGLQGIPSAAETAMIARDIELAELTGAHLHVAHLSTAGGVRLVRDAKRRGLPVTCEVTPHHVLLTEEAVGNYDTHKIMYPPLRAQEDVRALIEGLADRTIDAVATDHAPHGTGGKDVEFDIAARGVVGLETALPALLTLVQAEALSLSRAIELLTSGPAAVFDLPGGTLEEGMPAHVTVFDPGAEWLVADNALTSKSKNSPFLGWKMTGKVRYTVCAGEVIFGK